METTETIHLTIEDSVQNQRIDKVLSSVSAIGSRTQAQYLISRGAVLLKGKPIKASHITSLGETFEILIPIVSSEAPLSGYDIPLEILFEDEDVLVVNKPAPLVVHPSHGHTDKTLVNALVFHAKNLSMGFAEKRPGIVHRLDKETSGLLVIAKNNFSQEFLAHQFKERSIKRKYLALVYGHFKSPQGRIETLLNRHPVQRKRFASHPTNGKVAITHFKVLGESIRGFSLVECQLETGRTHQIRVHLSEGGHPIVADSLYGSDGRAKSLKSGVLRKRIMEMDRICLHAKELGFVHPKTRETLFFEVDPPSDILDLKKELGL